MSHYYLPFFSSTKTSGLKCTVILHRFRDGDPLEEDKGDCDALEGSVVCTACVPSTYDVRKLVPVTYAAWHGVSSVPREPFLSPDPGIPASRTLGEGISGAPEGAHLLGENEGDPCRLTAVLIRAWVGDSSGLPKSLFDSLDDDSGKVAYSLVWKWQELGDLLEGVAFLHNVGEAGKLQTVLTMGFGEPGVLKIDFRTSIVENCPGPVIDLERKVGDLAGSWCRVDIDFWTGSVFDGRSGENWCLLGNSGSSGRGSSWARDGGGGDDIGGDVGGGSGTGSAGGDGGGVSGGWSGTCTISPWPVTAHKSWAPNSSNPLTVSHPSMSTRRYPAFSYLPPWLPTILWPLLSSYLPRCVILIIGLVIFQLRPIRYFKGSFHVEDYIAVLQVNPYQVRSS